jgi:osmoprotectant transport system permease protein
VPSLALFVFMLALTGLTTPTVVIPLAVYTLSVLVRNVVDGIRSVPDSVRDAAVGMGFGPLRRLVQVELPVAVPLIMAGTRVATVSNISMVSIGSLVGFGGLGQLFLTYGIQLNFFLTAIVTGVVLTVALAVAADTLLVGVQRLLTPWVPRGAAR